MHFLKSFCLFTLIITCSWQCGYGQFWSKVGTDVDFSAPFKSLRGVYGIYYDTTNEKLLIYGQMHIYDSSSISPVASHTFLELNNNKWDTIDVRNIPFIGFSIADVIWYKGKYYAAGGFDELGSSKAYGWAQYENKKWDSLQVRPDKAGFTFSVIDDTLYMGGGFVFIDNIYSPGIVKYDGKKFHGMDPLQFDSSGMNAPRVYGIEKFKNMIVVGGSLREHQNSGIYNDLVVYKNGKKEVPLNWKIGTPSNVYDIAVFNEALYVAGSFKESDGVSKGNNIVRWDGVNWSRLGEGCNGQIYELEVFNDELIVVGLFDSCDGVQSKYIIKWNGNQWCSFTDVNFNNTISGVEVKDDTLYIIGGFESIGIDSINYLAKWSGGNSIIKCGKFYATGINENEDALNEIGVIYPNPNNGSFNIQLDELSNGEIKVFNTLGSLVYQINIIDRDLIQIDLPNSLVGGVYLVQLVVEGQIITDKIIVRRE